MVDPDGKTWTYSHDGHGYRNAVTDPLGDQTTTAYNADGWVMSSVSARGNVTGCGCATTYTTTYGHVIPGTGGTVLDQKDGKGDALLTYGYDSQGRVTTVADALGNVTSATYDGADNRLTPLDPVPGATCTGTPVGCTTFSHDADNELTGIGYSDGVTRNVGNITHDHDGRRTAGRHECNYRNSVNSYIPRSTASSEIYNSAGMGTPPAFVAGKPCRCDKGVGPLYSDPTDADDGPPDTLSRN